MLTSPSSHSKQVSYSPSKLLHVKYGLIPGFSTALEKLSVNEDLDLLVSGGERMDRRKINFFVYLPNSIIRRDMPMQPNEKARIARCAPDECAECIRMHGLTTRLSEDSASTQQAESTEHHEDTTSTATTDQALQNMQAKLTGHHHGSDAPTTGHHHGSDAPTASVTNISAPAEWPLHHVKDAKNISLPPPTSSGMRISTALAATAPVVPPVHHHNVIYNLG